MLNISNNQDNNQLHVKRLTNLCYGNNFVNYFDIGISVWETNIHIQQVFNYYKAIIYMCSYLSKKENECSQAMKGAFNKTLEKGVKCFEQMKSVAHAYW